MIDIATATEKARGIGVKYGFKSVKFIGEGSFGYVFKLGGKGRQAYAVKVTDGKKAMEETRALETLEKICSVKVPHVYECINDGNIGVIVMDFIDGVNATDIRSFFHGKKKRRAFAEQVADGVHSIISHTNDRFGDMDNPTEADWTEFYRASADDIIARIRECQDKRVKELKAIMEELYVHFDEIFSEKVEKASLIHGDLCPMNMIVSKNLELNAFIDPLDMRYADGEYELFQLFCQTGEYFKLYETYKEKYPVSKNCDIKTAFYAVFAEAEFFLNDGVYIRALINPLIKRAKRELLKFFGINAIRMGGI